MLFLVKSYSFSSDFLWYFYNPQLVFYYFFEQIWHCESFEPIFWHSNFRFHKIQSCLIRASQNRMIHKNVQLGNHHTQLDVSLSMRKFLALKWNNATLKLSSDRLKKFSFSPDCPWLNTKFRDLPWIPWFSWFSRNFGK